MKWLKKHTLHRILSNSSGLCLTAGLEANEEKQSQRKWGHLCRFSGCEWKSWNVKWELSTVYIWPGPQREAPTWHLASVITVTVEEANISLYSVPHITSTFLIWINRVPRGQLNWNYMVNIRNSLLQYTWKWFYVQVILKLYQVSNWGISTRMNLLLLLLPCTHLLLRLWHYSNEWPVLCAGKNTFPLDIYSTFFLLFVCELFI